MAISFISKFGEKDSDTVAGLESKFKNTKLENYLPVVISFFFRETHAWEDGLLDKTRNDVCVYLGDMLKLALFLRDLKEGKAKGPGWHIDSRSDLGVVLYDTVESFFLKKLDDFHNVLHNYEWEEFTPDIITEWERSLSAFPSSDGFLKEEKIIDDEGNEISHLSLNEITDAVDSIRKCEKVAKGFILDSDEEMVKRFVAYMIENKVPESRSMYRCWYDALDCFWGIPVVIKESHKNLPPESYAKSNYIKSFAVRYHKNSNRTSTP